MQLDLRRRVVYVVPAVMILVAAVQAVRVSTDNLSPWIGAGFGMFATVDGHHRLITVFDRDGTEVEIPTSIAVARFRNHPTPAAIGELGDSSLNGPGTVIVTRPVFDPDTGHVTWEVVIEVEVP